MVFGDKKEYPSRFEVKNIFGETVERGGGEPQGWPLGPFYYRIIVEH